MLNTKYVRDNTDAIRKSLAKRKSDYPLDELLQLDEKSRKTITDLQALRAQRNKGSLEISAAKKAGKQLSEAKVKEMAEVKERIEGMEKTLLEYDNRIDQLLWNMPNVLDASVPYGKDESENKEVKKVGEAGARKGAGHEEILNKLGLLDIESAAKVSGARFYYLLGDLALLEQSLIRFAIDELMKKGYTLVSPPLMLKKDYYRGVTAFSDFEDMLYKASPPKEAGAGDEDEKAEDDMYMIATSEHAIAAMYADRVFSAKELPRRYIGVSPCFRREAGAHGKDTKGIFRVHQFYKVEQFVFSNNEDSWKIFDELMANSEGIFRKLGIPYRIVNICTGDIGTVAAKKYDLEAWLPVQGKYREMVSCSNCTDWQSIRLDIRYDKGGERMYAHTLNATALAVERTMVAIVENYSKDDGTITVPDALVSYMGKDRIA